MGDVAIHFRALAESVGFEADVESDDATDANSGLNANSADRFSPNPKYDRTPEGIDTVRVQRYLERCGTEAPRAVGPGWLKSLGVPRSETEALAELDGKPIFRARFLPSRLA